MVTDKEQYNVYLGKFQKKQSQRIQGEREKQKDNQKGNERWAAYGWIQIGNNITYILENLRKN